MVLRDTAGARPRPLVFPIAPLHRGPGKRPGVIDADMDAVVFRSGGVGANACIVPTWSDDVHSVLQARGVESGLEEIDAMLQNVIVGHPGVRQDFHILPIPCVPRMNSVRIRRRGRRGCWKGVPIPDARIGFAVVVFRLDHEQTASLVKDGCCRRKAGSGQCECEDEPGPGERAPHKNGRRSPHRC